MFAAVLTVPVGLYVLGVRRLWRRAGRGQGVRGWQVLAFLSGVVVLAIALTPPIDRWADQLLSAHMSQHELLMLVAAPLCVLGAPGLAWLWGVPEGARNAISHVLRHPQVASAWQRTTHPAAAATLHGVALWVWHIPRLFGAALAIEGLHGLQHAAFFGTASLFWWSMVHGRFGRLGYGASVVFVFLTAAHSSLLGALMTFSPTVWYDAYAQIAAGLHRDALADQQLAGLVMWIPSGVVFIAFGLGLLAAWLGESTRRAAINLS